MEELRKLEALTTKEEVRRVLQTELAALAPHLAVAPSAEVGAAASSAAHGYEADGDDAAVTTQTKQPTAAAPSPSFKTPLNTQSRKSAASAPPEPNTPADAFDPAKWPVVSCDALPPECWHPAQGCVRAVPRWPYDSPQARRLMGEGKPVILTRAPLTTSAASKWNLDYLVRNLGELACTVFKSSSSNFRYWDEAKLPDGKRCPTRPGARLFKGPARGRRAAHHSCALPLCGVASSAVWSRRDPPGVGRTTCHHPPPILRMRRSDARPRPPHRGPAHPTAAGEEMPPQTAKLTMKASEFAAAVRAIAAGEEQGGQARGGEKYYMQTALVEGVATVRAHCMLLQRLRFGRERTTCRPHAVPTTSRRRHMPAHQLLPGSRPL